MGDHHFPEDKAGHLRVRLIVEQEIKGMIFCPDPVAVLAFLIEMERQAGNGLCKDSHTGIHSGHLHCGAFIDCLPGSALSEEEAVDKIAETPFEEMQFAAIDHHRELRQGMPEVIYAAGKTPEQVRDIFYSLYTHSQGNILATRARREHYEKVLEKVPEAEYDETARAVYLDRDASKVRDEQHQILILTAGTSDIPHYRAEKRRLILNFHFVYPPKDLTTQFRFPSRRPKQPAPPRQDCLHTLQP